MAKFWQPPILRNTQDNHDEHRHVSWLELFHDLAFVAAIASVAHELSNIDLFNGALAFVMLFIPVWWAWLGDAIYNNRYDPQDHTHEILTLLQMFGIIGLAIFAHDGLGAGFTGFALSFTVVRGILAFLNYRIGKHNKEERGVAFFLAGTIVLSQLFWISAIFADGPLRFTLAGIALAIELLAPLLNARQQQQAYLNASHLSARFGFFIIIMLGEIVTAVVRSVVDVGPTTRELFLGATAIIIGFAIWWIYFENDTGPRVIINFFTPKGKLEKKNILSGYTWVYAHLPLAMGLMAMALASERIITLGSNISLTPRLQVVLMIGTSVALGSIGIMQMAALTHEWCQKLNHLKMILPFISIIILLSILAFGSLSSPLTIMSTFAIVLFVQVLSQEIIEHIIDEAKKESVS